VKFGVEGTIENASPITREQYDDVIRELARGKVLILQAAQVIQEQRNLIERLKQELDRGKSGTSEIPSRCGDPAP